MLKGLLVVIAIASSTAFAYDFPEKPDPQVTKGDLCDPEDKDFAGYRYEEKIAYCERNVDFTRKKRIYEAYGVPEHCRREYTIDHYLPLSLGGSNEDANLWPEHKNVKATRQTLEQEMFEKIKNGQISQERALKVIVEAKLNPPPPQPEPCH